MIYTIIFFVLAHCVFDWAIRRMWEANRKNKLLHCFVYALGFVPVFLIFGINFLWLVLLFSSHLLIDSVISPEKMLESIEKYFSKKRFGIHLDKNYSNHQRRYWALVGGEQILHLFILVIIIKYGVK